MPAEARIDELLATALRAAAAGARILDVGYGRTLAVGQKSGGPDLVTEVDLAAERAVRDALGAERPNDVVTGEELADSVPEGAEVRWSIDPLDGTTNYLRRIPYFGTSLGAQDLLTGEWLVGVVHAPALGRVYFAGRGLGARVLEAGEERRLEGPSGATGARILGTGVAYDARVRAEQYRELAGRMAEFNDLRAFGAAALGICAVADGTIDGFIEENLGEYDWAGAAVIAEEAGLEVVRPTSPADPILIRRAPSAD